jgi:hypothetical protein
MTTGSSDDIVDRLYRVLPRRWFAWTAPYRDAVLGGISDSASWCYGLIGYAKAQTRIATAYGIWLDILCYDFLGLNLTRNGTPDDVFRSVIKATILQERVTREGMIAAVTQLTGATPWIFEPWNTYDTGGYSGQNQKCGSFGYGSGQGAYGNMKLHNQIFMKVYRGFPGGVPNVSGYGKPAGGYGQGSIAYVGANSQQVGLTQAQILQVINLTKPVGTTVWVQFPDG